MGKWTKTAGLLFLAAASVYSSQVIVEALGNGAAPKAQASANAHVAAAPTQVASAPTHTPKIYAAPETTTDVKVLDEGSDPFANNAGGATTQPSAEAGGATASAGAAAPTTQPGEGRSVSSSE